MVSCVPKRWRKQPSGTTKRFWVFFLVFGRQEKQTSESIKGTWADLFSLTMAWILESCTTAVCVSIWFCEIFCWFLRQTRSGSRPSAAENLIVVLLDVRRSFDPLLAKLLAALPPKKKRSTEFHCPMWKKPCRHRRPTLSLLVTKMRINWLQELDGILLPMSQKWHFTKNYVNSGWEELLTFGVPLLLPQHMSELIISAWQSGLRISERTEPGAVLWCEHLNFGHPKKYWQYAPFYPQIPEEFYKKCANNLLVGYICIFLGCTLL